MKRLLLAFSLFFITPVSAAEITSRITDSVQLGVQGAAVQSTRIGASYSASGTNIQATSFGGVSGAGTYDINTPGQAFTFSESFNAADTPVTTQTVSGVGDVGYVVDVDDIAEVVDVVHVVVVHVVKVADVDDAVVLMMLLMLVLLLMSLVLLVLLLLMLLS